MATYYIKPDGDDEKDGLSLENAWATIGKANTTLSAGDTVYICNGTYAESIAPSNSGSAGNYIRYENYTGHTPVISRYATLTGWTQYDGEIYQRDTPASGYGLWEDDWPTAGKYTGMSDGPGIADPDVLERGQFYCNGTLYARCSDGADPDTHTMRWTNANGADLEGKDYIAIDGITFSYCMNGTPLNDSNHCIIENCTYEYIYGYGIMISGGSTYNHIHHNLAQYIGSWYRDEGDFVHFSNCSYNLAEYNETQYIAHIGITAYGAGNIPHHNIIQHNECHHGGSSGISAGVYPEYNVYRYNKSYYHTGCGLQTNASNNLWYGNECWYNGWEEDADSPNLCMFSEALNNRIFHNTFYDSMNCVVEIVEYTDTVDNNVFKNNIFFHDDSTIEIYTETLRSNLFTHNVIYDANHQNIQTAGDGTQTVAWFESEYGDNFSDNVTSNPSLTDPDNGDMTLQEGSPCINAGDWLTLITSETGSGTSFVVTDADYFIDGYGLVTGDTIYLERGDSAVITDVNYDTNTITVDESVAWEQNDGVTLIDFTTAPDIGANQYEEEAPPETTQHDDVIGFGANF
jgi:hypothetical protein